MYCRAVLQLTVLPCVLQEVESALPTLLGDATLAAAAVVYLAPLLPSQRAAALSAWHELLQGARVPVSGQFELRAFLGPRERRLLAPIASDVLVRLLLKPCVIDTMLCLPASKACVGWLHEPRTCQTSTPGRVHSKPGEPTVLWQYFGISDKSINGCCHTASHLSQAGACPAWRESMVLLSAASRPPLLLDAGREASVLVKALHGGRTSQRVFLTIQVQYVRLKTCVVCV